LARTIAIWRYLGKWLLFLRSLFELLNMFFSLV